MVPGHIRPVVLTGAGISAPSGLPTYRGEGGWWTNNPDAKASSTPPPDELVDPIDRRAWWDRLWASQFGPLRAAANAAEPNAAHRAITEWQQLRPDLVVITQNVDGLHQRAGTTNVWELHGSVHRTRCADDGCGAVLGDDVAWTRAPDCVDCGGPCRPDVVLFGEYVDALVDHRTKRLVDAADVLVAVGTTAQVWTAARLVARARYEQIETVAVNLGGVDDPSAFGSVFDAPAEIWLPAMVAELTEPTSRGEGHR